MVKNTRIIEYIPHRDKQYGSLIALEAGKDLDVPFPINRVYYIYDVPDGQRRGFHSHNDLEQILICVHGRVKILTKTPYEEETVLLDDPTKGLYIGPMVWREMYDFEDGAVLLVLASKHYDVKDYIRDYGEYETAAREYFAKEEM